MNPRKLCILLLNCFAFAPLFVEGKIELPPIFNDGMVLQCDRPVAVWGSAEPEASVTVSFKGQVVTGKADSEGNWQVALAPLSATSEPSILKVTSELEAPAVEIKDVVVGEVWIAGGQSNMVFLLRNSKHGKETIDQMDAPNIRFYTVARYEGFESNVPEDSGWVKADGSRDTTVFSAVAYHFAADIQSRIGIPVGIVSCNIGSSAAETWMSPEALRKDPELSYMADRFDDLLLKSDPEALKAYDTAFSNWLKQGRASGEKAPKKPETPFDRRVGTAMYRSMLSKIIPYSVRGAIWYQGESNTKISYEYRDLFPALIQHWREEFQNPEMPFYFVQLASFDWPGDRHDQSIWAELRESQLVTWQTVDNTGMVVSADFGEKKDIHPKAKKPIGERLARFARRDVYGEADLAVSGPIYKSMTIENGKAILEFDFVEGGLEAKGTLTDFEICGEDKSFVPAQAEIAGNTVVVSSSEVSNPIAVRYGWENWFVPTLYNGEGLPASPFRTDNFKLHTQP